MKTITITTNNRPELLERMLQSLQTCFVHQPGDLWEHYQVFAGCEPGCPRNVELLLQHVPPSQITVNSQCLGVRHNPYETLKRAFAAGSEANVYLEDDIVLAPDAFQMAEWYWSIQQPRHLCLNFLNYHSDPARPATVLETADEFNALGVCLTRQSWQEHFEPSWFIDLPGFAHGWDWSVHRRLRANGGLFTLQPALSRSNHTGRYGVHCRPRFHDQMFANLAVNSDPGPFEYRIV